MQKRTEILKIDPDYPQKERIAKAADFIKKGKLVAFPTETVYGLGTDGLNPEAIRLLFKVKKRPPGKAVALLISDFADLNRLAKDIPPKAFKVIDRFWPGPLTIIFQATGLVPEIIRGKGLTAGISDTADISDTVGIRMPDNKIALALIESAKTPIACPSANISGECEPTTSQEVISSLADKIDLIIDGGKTRIGIASTLLDLTGKIPTILRKGAISSKELLKTLNSKHILFVCTGNTCRSFMAEKLFRKMAAEVEINLEIQSAGTSANPQGEIPLLSLKALEKEGIIPEKFTPTPLSERLIKKADLILVMEEYHQRRVLDILPSAKEKTFLLTDYAVLGKKDIPDPMGGSWEGYETCLIEIKKCLNQVITRLKE
ncbi:MAG: L-threonylcarbamoyladenylate synthase [bacterium]|nr:L-threonylcarbamoyladenylate synthase [bacterium]